MFGKSKGNAADDNHDSSSAQEIKRSAVAHPASPAAPEAVSSISSGLSIVGKIVGEGTLGIFGHVEGEVHASTVQIGEGARVEGNIVADELTIGGRVKGMIHANRVRLNSTAVVEGDIYHRSLAIEENAQFEGMSRRQESVVDTPSLVPSKRLQAQPISIDVNGQGGAPEDLNPPQALPIDRNRRKATSDVPNP